MCDYEEMSDEQKRLRIAHAHPFEIKRAIITYKEVDEGLVIQMRQELSWRRNLVFKGLRSWME